MFHDVELRRVARLWWSVDTVVGNRRLAPCGVGERLLRDHLAEVSDQLEKNGELRFRQPDGCRAAKQTLPRRVELERTEAVDAAAAGHGTTWRSCGDAEGGF